MIVRIQFLVSLWSAIGYIVTTNGMYLNFNAPQRKPLENLQNKDFQSPGNMDQWLRKGYNQKKLIILDRKNKQVNEFVKTLLNVIEMNNTGKLVKEDTRKMKCRHVSFGSIYDARAKRKRCKKQLVYKRKQPWINFMIPVPVKRNFVYTTPERFADDYLQDIDRRDTDFDYFNTIQRAVESETKPNGKESAKMKRTEDVKNNEEPESLRKHHTRFQIIPNKDESLEYNGKRTKEKEPKPSDNSDSDDTDDSNDSDEDKEKKSKKSDSDTDDDARYKKPSKSQQLEMKKIKYEWNDIINTPDNIFDSSEVNSNSPLKKNNKHKKSDENNSSENENGDTDRSSEEFEPHKNNKYGSDNEKYAYMQGHRIYDAKNEDSRRMRLKNYFLPKRSFWSEDSIKHLGAYWNSHEIAGVHAK